MSTKLKNGKYKQYSPLNGKHLLGPCKGQVLNYYEVELFTTGVKEKLLNVATRTRELLKVK
jgi:hypothetical protein